MAGKADAVSLLYAIQVQQTVLTGNHADFEDLHHLVIGSGGHHSSILAFPFENDPARDMKPMTIVTAIRKLESAGVPIAAQIHVLNQWR
jgi:hypothetical protein